MPLQVKYPVTKGLGEISCRQHGASAKVEARGVEDNNSHKGKHCFHCKTGFEITSNFINCNNSDSKC